MDNSLAALADRVGHGSPSHLQRLEFLVSTIPVVIHTCQAEGDFSATFVSDGVRALWGHEPEEFLKNNRFWMDRLHPEDADRIVAGLSVVLTAGQYNHEYRFRTKSGEYRCVRDELVTTLVNGFGKAAADKHLRLTFDIQPEIPVVLLGDPDCLWQVLVNLLGNAIKFTRTGEVKLNLEMSPESSDHVLFRVHDTGIGISPDQRQRIFEPFTQVDGSSRREFGGTGLGLAISAQLVEMLGGEIWVVSDGRSGSTFHFTARLKSANVTAETPSHAVLALVPVPEPVIESRQVPFEERRKHPRFQSHDTVKLNLLSSSSQACIDVQVLNVSNGGLRLWTGQSLATGTLVEIQREDEITVASVRYCVPADHGFHAGVRFRGHFDKM